MRIRNRPSDSPMMLLRRRKQNEEDTGGGLDPKCHTTEMSLAKDLPARWFSLSFAPPLSFVVKPGRPSSDFARVEACSTRTYIEEG
jgi:hypothetical protein